MIRKILLISAYFCISATCSYAANWSMNINMWQPGVYTSSNGYQQEHAGDRNRFHVYTLLQANNWNGGKSNFINALNSNDTDGDGFSDYSEIYWRWGNYSVVTSILENPNTPTMSRLTSLLGRYWYYDKATASVQRWNGITLDNVDYWDLNSSIRGLINTQNQILGTDINGHIKMLGATNQITNNMILTGGVTMQGESATSTNAFTNNGTMLLGATSRQLGWIDRPGYEPHIAIMAESVRSAEAGLDAALRMTGMVNTLTNNGTIDGNGAGVIELTGAANSLFNLGAISCSSISLLGNTTEATGELVNSGTLDAAITMSETADNSVTNRAGGVFTGSVNMNSSASNELTNETGGVYYGYAVMSGPVNSIQNEGNLEGNLNISGSTNILTNLGTISNSSVTVTGPTVEATTELTNHGSWEADVAINNTATNTLTNMSGRIFTGDLSLSATGSNTFVNDGDFSGNIDFSANGGSLVNNQVIASLAISLNGAGTNSHATIFNNGSLGAVSITLDAEENIFEAASGTNTVAESLLFHPSFPGSGTNTLSIDDVGLASGGSFISGVQFLNSSAINNISVSNSDVNFTSANIGWGNNTRDTFSAIDSVIRAPNGLLLGGATGGGTFSPLRAVMTGDITLQNISLSGAFGESETPLLHFAGQATLDGVTVLNSGNFIEQNIGQSYGEKIGLITADILSVGSGGVFVDSENGAQRIDGDTPRVKIDYVSDYVGLDYVWTVEEGNNGFIGIQTVFKENLFETMAGPGDLGQILDQMLYQPDKLHKDLLPLFLHISTFTTKKQYRDALEQLNSQSNLSAAEIATRLWAINETHSALNNRFDAWRDQLLLADFSLCFRNGISRNSRQHPANKNSMSKAEPERATHTNIAQKDDGLPQPSTFSNLEQSGMALPIRRFQSEAFLEIYGSRTSQNSCSTFTGYNSGEYGAVAGFDFNFNNLWHLGSFFNVSNTNTYLLNNTGRITDTALRLGGYSSLNMDALYYDTVMSIGYHDLASVRQIPFLSSAAEATYSGTDVSWMNTLGYRFELPWKLYLTVSDTLTISGLCSAERSEDGAALNANMHYDKHFAAVVQNTIGVRIARPIKISNCLVIYPRFNLNYEYGNYFTEDLTSSFAVAPEYSWQTPIELPDLGRIGAGLGINTYISSRFSITANMNAKIWNTGIAWSGNIGCGMKF